MIDLSRAPISEQVCEIGNARWNVTTLIECAKDLEPFDFPVEHTDLGIGTFGDNMCAYDMACHIKRVLDADLQYPIIISHKGTIMDGHHRVVKAILDGKKTIKAVRFEKTPTPDNS